MGRRILDWSRRRVGLRRRVRRRCRLRRDHRLRRLLGSDVLRRDLLQRLVLSGRRIGLRRRILLGRRSLDRGMLRLRPRGWLLRRGGRLPGLRLRSCRLLPLRLGRLRSRMLRSRRELLGRGRLLPALRLLGNLGGGHGWRLLLPCRGLGRLWSGHRRLDQRRWPRRDVLGRQRLLPLGRLDLRLRRQCGREAPARGLGRLRFGEEDVLPARLVGHAHSPSSGSTTAPGGCPAVRSKSRAYWRMITAAT
jgi:hypothetical protein